MFNPRKGAIWLLFVAVTFGAARADDALGAWTRDDGAVKIEFLPCGASLCGAVVWLRNPHAAAKVGQRVFYDMMRSDQITWIGKAFNPEDGRTYAGRMVLSGKKLKTSGCVLGGLICKTVLWMR